MTTIPAVNAPKDLGKARLAIVVGNQVMSIPAAGMYQPLDADLTALAGIGTSIAGDLIYSPSNGTWARLAKGTALQNLRMNAAGTAPEWAAAREVLTANRTYYVRTDGSNSNNGLANTAGGAFLTVQKAIDVISTIDLGGYTATISVQSGNHGTATTNISAGWVGGNVTITLNAGAIVGGFYIMNIGGILTINGPGKIQPAASTCCIDMRCAGTVQFGGVELGDSGTVAHIQAYQAGATLISIDSYSISGNASAHLRAISGGFISTVGGVTVTLVGTRAFTFVFAQATVLGMIRYGGNTFSGSATGSRYFVSTNSVIEVAGGGANYFPGSTAGSALTGGQYV